MTISVVRGAFAKSPAAKAGLMVGDVLTLIGVGGPAGRPRERRIDFAGIQRFVTARAQSRLEVLRGLPNPYAIAPAALDLFVGSMSLRISSTDGRLHDLPRRAGECHRFQVGFAHSQRPGAGRQVDARLRLVQQPSLDLPDDAEAVFGKHLLEVPSRSRGVGAERAVSRSAGPEFDGRLQHDSPVRLFRLSRNQRL